ncbi:MAG: hypothetical protein AB1450_04955 [Pseudomonadota bacterium]
MNESKPWWESKTVVINAVAAVLIALEAQWHLLQPYLPFNFWMGMSVALPIVNGVLRAVTSQPITFGGAGARPLE